MGIVSFLKGVDIDKNRKRQIDKAINGPVGGGDKNNVIRGLNSNSLFKLYTGERYTLITPNDTTITGYNGKTYVIADIYKEHPNLLAVSGYLWMIFKPINCKIGDYIVTPFNNMFKYGEFKILCGLIDNSLMYVCFDLADYYNLNIDTKKLSINFKGNNIFTIKWNLDIIKDVETPIREAAPHYMFYTQFNRVAWCNLPHTINYAGHVYTNSDFYYKNGKYVNRFKSFDCATGLDKYIYIYYDKNAYTAFYTENIELIKAKFQ